ncbi:nucleolar protein-like protein 14 [Clathrospora elynae]|uniref:Nucleolar protein-like protein 14 n=1 Tax=Clathrospora elynae TaxID=706981 RepID=A0A6A5T3H7_9PLEO|nr:nucleolar protein-like protein 14 [Clathrospora elynae]
MAPSQLKRLKASLREQGITGPQKSKKQKKSQSKSADHHAQKASALASIRESFNPFEFKHLARPEKFEYVSAQPANAPKKILGRPGVMKSKGEELRRKSLLPEMNRKNKVGGILDRRIGENDPTMSMEDRMMARFEREQQRKRDGNVFDLEGGDDDEVMLTHGGQSLQFDDEIGEEDYDAASIAGSSDDEDGFLKKKRRREDVDGEVDGGAPEEEQPERKKTKAEVMKEVVAKSKAYKYERQTQKEDDDELRDELDKGLPDVLAALYGHINQKPEPEVPKHASNNEFGINADRAALLAGTTQQDKDREYDKRVRQLMQDERAKPTERTKTEEEKAREEADRLKELEQKRMKRMRGEPTSDDEGPQKKVEDDDDDDDEEDAESTRDDAAEFGLTTAPGQLRPDGVEDEDDFIMDDDLIATDSEADISDDESDAGSAVDDTMAMDDDDADFLKNVLPERKEQPKAVNGVLTLGAEPTSKLAFTYACPRSHEELLTVFKAVAPSDISTVIQRIRALYHAGLSADNKNKLADFACALIDHVAYLSNQTPAASLAVIEAMIRHVHSMSRSYPVQVATKFREHLKQLQVSNDPTPGDLAILTAIGTIFPTSDHFHQVVTPAVTLMARWMGLTTPASAKDVATGAFIAAVCLQYQKLSKRYIPELIRYTSLSLRSQHSTPALSTAHAKNILTAAELWSTSPAFIEIFTPLLAPLRSANQASTLQNLRARLSLARSKRRPLLLHNHRPLPITMKVPKFEVSYDPNKHYDADKEKAESIRLQKEYRRERKGAMRELRKDSNFIARESLKEKKEKDKAYETKYRRLVAEIQGEEGREKNSYEREKKKRQRG